MSSCQKAPKLALLLLNLVWDIRARLRQVQLVHVLVWSWGHQVCKLEAELPRHSPQTRPARLEPHRAKQPGVYRRAAPSKLAAGGAAAGGPAGSRGSSSGGKGFRRQGYRAARWTFGARGGGHPQGGQQAGRWAP